MKRLSETARQTSSRLKTDDMRREHRMGTARKFPENVENNVSTGAPAYSERAKCHVKELSL